MYRLIAIFCTGLLFLSTQAVAMRPYSPVSPDPFAETWRWTFYPELNEQGLRCLAQTTDGAMWFGTDSGVQRYDGHSWTEYTPKSGLLGAPVYALCATQDNRLYAGTEQGISLFENGTWRPFFPTKNDLTWPINTLYETPDGQLWAGTPWGALHLQTENPVLYTTAETARAINTLSPDIITQIIPDPIVPVTQWRPREPYAGIGIRAIEGSWASLRSRNMPRTIFLVAPNSPAKKAGLQIGDRISAIDGIQPAWTNDAVKGLSNTDVTLTIQRPGQTQPFDVQLKRTILPGEFRECLVYTITQDKTGILWFGLARGEVIRTPIQTSRLNPQKSWQLYTTADSLQLDYAPTLYTANDSTIWAASQSGDKRLFQFDGTQWVPKAQSVRATTLLQTRDNTIWASGHKLYSFQEDSLQIRGLPSGVPHNYIRLLEAQDGALWLAGLGEGAARFDYQTTRWQTHQDLIFLFETKDGTRWFRTPQKTLISHHHDRWQAWGPEDGLMNTPNALVLTNDNQPLAIGYQNNQLATALFNGTGWVLTQHPNCKIEGPIRTALYADDGSLWVGGTMSYGVFQYSPDGIWQHHMPPEAPAPAACLTQTKNGDIWVGGWYGLRRFDGKTWHVITDQIGLTSYTDALLGDSQGDLWVGTRLYGIFRYNGKTWFQYNISEGVADINISHLIETNDQSILAVTRSGISRFDRETWVAQALPHSLSLRVIGTAGAYASLAQTSDDAIWLNTIDAKTVRYQPSPQGPETSIITSLDRVSQPGNTAISWTGNDPWKATPNNELQYAYRLDQGPWSPFTHKTSDVFFALPSGPHIFEVQARDRDFNVDPTPAVLSFHVEAPFWQQPEFLILITLLCATIALQTRRAFKHNQQLKASHRALETALRDLQDSQQRLHSVVTGAPVIFWAIDLQGTLTFLQGKEQETLGLAESDVVGTSVFDLFKTHGHLCADLQRALQGDAFTSVCDLFGTTFEIRHSPLHNADGHRVGAIGVGTDISERIRVETERLRLDEELHHLRYLYRLRVALGEARTPAELLEQAGTALLATLSSAVSSEITLTNDDQQWTFGTPVKSGAYYYRRPIVWGNRHRGALTVASSFMLTESQERALLDETTGQIAAALEARELEAQLLQSARLVSLGQMAAGVAHDLNQPLAAISATAEGILLRWEAGMDISRKRVTAMMDDIMGLVDRMIASINNLRIFSRDTSQEPGCEFSVNESIRTSLKIIGAQIKNHGIRIKLDLAPNLPLILGHPHQIEQVMLNLLGNARDALEERAVQNTDTTWVKQLQIATKTNQNRVVIEVTDNGSGIDPAHLHRLFEPFYTTKPADKGTGIGLSIVYAIIQNHQGDITCESQKNHATTFRVTLPIATTVSQNDPYRSHPEYSAH